MKYKLGDVLTVKHGFPFKSEFFQNEGHYIVLTPANFNEKGGFKNTPGKEKFYSGNFPKEYICRKNDLIVVMTQQAEGLLGSTAFVPESGKYLHNQRIGLITTKQSLLLPEYANFLFRTHNVRKQIRDTASGTKIKHTSPEKIYDVTVELPNITEQRSVAELLQAIEEKISNNELLCDELEALAKLIYDYWFVQFDFPDERGRPYKSSGGSMVWNEALNREIPLGWKVTPFRGQYTIQRGISYTSEDIVSGTGVPMLNLACFDTNRNYRDGEIKYISGNKSKACYAKSGDLILACTDLTRNADIIGSPILVPDDETEYLFSMDLAKIQSVNDEIDDYYLYMALRTESYHNYIKKWASGTNVLHLDLAGLDWYQLLIPPMELQQRFRKFINVFHMKSSAVLFENRQLASLLDFLLPMLMNGQVTICEPENTKA